MKILKWKDYFISLFIRTQLNGFLSPVMESHTCRTDVEWWEQSTSISSEENIAWGSQNNVSWDIRNSLINFWNQHKTVKMKKMFMCLSVGDQKKDKEGKFNNFYKSYLSLNCILFSLSLFLSLTHTHTHTTHTDIHTRFTNPFTPIQSRQIPNLRMITRLLEERDWRGEKNLRLEKKEEMTRTKSIKGTKKVPINV